MVSTGEEKRERDLDYSSPARQQIIYEEKKILNFVLEIWDSSPSESTA
ncbi:hypothetical protein FOCG_13201 [Fusarium oxysporum f. sp. radicis-lycopersici 26381]|uniref:Uncharacterized protein n=3 Tax=Fusarium oxysporum TaxID=5507 RepID=A0A4Q2VXY3_FUSOX|nr:hypothetical protein FOZG_13893 [Fusarium oxysporum Fo47]EXL45847.1 hypothetical protein FOCG_13201 [Fusarium oxysporum f. sp. radicis-lycopersici 26381]RKK11392.1 hypothetical protein BFJ65_g13275 [Fusarium oxysporum f. sp. cepae]RKL42148.1 hypothetical protein BFJ70_g4891 [Fusarium oxysporum]RYC91877.1 hypothetical protein BFJ63_vAg5320 [Fusarium oxysporum f. sp. narcissi]